MADPLVFRLNLREGAPRRLPFWARRLVIAGWAGRDDAALAHHIAELRAIGIAPPSRTPLFYAASADLLTHADDLQVLGHDTSGEVEPLLVATEDGLLVGLASDHTDRHAEAWSVPHSKQLCGKPAAPDLWRFDDVSEHWDALVLRSWIADGDAGWTLYQEGAVAALRRPDDLAALAGGLPPGAAMLCGTLPAIGGIRPAARFRMELSDPVLGRAIEHAYGVSGLAVVA